MTSSYLALGGNVGPVARTFESALEQIAALPATSVLSVSGVFRFPAVGDNAGDDFCNAAAHIDTGLDPRDLLDHLQQIENRHGRMREIVWGPRPLDLDVILYGDQVISHPRLRVPHPACWYGASCSTRCAKSPLMLSTLRSKQRSLNCARLMPRPLPVRFVGNNDIVREVLLPSLTHEFPEVAFAPLNDPALLIWLRPTESGKSSTFESLPLLPRLDASEAHNPLDFVRGVLHSALGR